MEVSDLGRIGYGGRELTLARAPAAGPAAAAWAVGGAWWPWPLPDDPRWDVIHAGRLAALPVPVAVLALAGRDIR